MCTPGFNVVAAEGGAKLNYTFVVGKQCIISHVLIDFFNLCIGNIKSTSNLNCTSGPSLNVICYFPPLGLIYLGLISG